MATSRRSPRAALFHLFDEAATPVYALDPMRQITYCNDALARWLGAKSDELIGVRCHYHSDTSGNAFSLAAPPSVYAGQACRGTVMRKQIESVDALREAMFLPIMDDDRKCLGVVATVGPCVNELSEEKLVDDTTLHQQIQQFRLRYRHDYALDRLIGNSSAIQLVRDRIALASKSLARVVIVGPPGSGREHVARTIHAQTQSDRLPPIVPLDCTLLDAELLETTVTAFVRRCAELVIEGIPCLLLLDVDQLSNDAQDVLHNFLSIREFELRTLATSRSPLSDVVATNGFHGNLAAMLSTVTIRLPSLSERLADIPLLSQYAIERLNTEVDKQVEGFSEQATRQLIQYPWPGNVDQLMGMVREIHDAATKPIVSVEDLPRQIRLGIDADTFPILETETVQLDEFLGNVERELIVRAMRQANGNKAQAARLLGLPRARFLRRLAHFEIE